MPGIPARCDNCRIVFDSGYEVQGEGAVFHFEDCATACPKCEGPAELLDGAYTTVGDLLQVVSGSTFTRQQVRLMNEFHRKLAKRSEKQEFITDDIIKAATAISAPLGEVMRQAKNKNYKLAAAVLVLGALTQQCSSSAPLINIDNSTHVTEVYNVTSAPIPLASDGTKNAHEYKKNSDHKRTNGRPDSTRDDSKNR